jgi:D-alanyl-D-alanine dipeptidase
MKKYYQNLENKMVKYQDLINVKVSDCKEKLVPVLNQTVDNQKILLRESIVKKLIITEKILLRKNTNYRFLINCGYRSLKIQTERFLEILNKMCKKYYANPIELYEAVHRSIAIPTVAGHPTGGAVDITIIDIRKKNVIDFGSKIYDYSTKDFYVLSPNVSKKARKNRMLLRKIMLVVGFAPFDGEWWHFSYGDREWAFYYKKKCAIYDQLDLLK